MAGHDAHGDSNQRVIALGRDTETPLTEARDLFASMGYKPALAETEALLGRAAAAAS